MSTPAGWYPDPANTAQLRWWDGSSWTEHLHTETPLSFEKREAGPPRWEPSNSPESPTPWGQPSSSLAGGYGAGGTLKARAVATPDGAHLGNLGLRLLARIVDGLLLTTLTFVVGNGFISRAAGIFADQLALITRAAETGATPPSAWVLREDPSFVTAISGLTLIYLATSAAYTILLVKFYGATVGKLLFGLRVRPWSRPGHPSWGQSILRWVTSDLAGNFIFFYPLLNYLWPTWDKRRQALHDKLGGTVVVKR